MYYEIYKKDIIPCMFCGMSSNLYYIKNHIKQSKRCKIVQNELKKIEPDEFTIMHIEFNKKINSLKAERRLEEHVN